MKRAQVTEVHLDILGQRSLKATPNYGQPCTSTEKEKQIGMTYIHCAQSLAKIYPTVFGSWLQRTRTGRRGERERERLSKCWFGVCLGQTTEYTERETELHSCSLEVQTVLRAKFSNILSAQVDKTVICVCVCVYQTVFSRADKPGRVPTYYCEFQVSARVHPALVVSHHEETYM